jgi:hypothetical protein
LSKIALLRAWTTSPLKSVQHRNDLEKYFQPGPFYDTLLYLYPIPTKLSKIAQNCYFTGLDDLPAQKWLKQKMIQNNISSLVWSITLCSIFTQFLRNCQILPKIAILWAWTTSQLKIA